MEDDDVLRLLELCDKYASLMISLNKKMSSGYFNMTLARKEPRITSIDNIRFTLSPSLLAYQQKSKQITRSDQFIGWNIQPKSGTTTATTATTATTITKHDDNNDTLLYMCALPPKSLRQSQSHFVDSLKDISELTYISNEIKMILDKQ